MNGFVIAAIAAIAAIGAVLFARRRSRRGDAARVQDAARDGAARVGRRFRRGVGEDSSGSGEVEVDQEQPSIDLTDTSELAASPESEGDEEATSRETTTPAID
jgi:hypothetical protein